MCPQGHVIKRWLGSHCVIERWRRWSGPVGIARSQLVSVRRQGLTDIFQAGDGWSMYRPFYRLADIFPFTIHAIGSESEQTLCSLPLKDVPDVPAVKTYTVNAPPLGYIAALG